MIALAAALVGGGVVAGVGALDDDEPAPRPGVVVAEIDATGDAVAAPVRIPAGSFDPSRIYATRASGVVTVDAVFPESGDRDQTSQGSGFVVSPDGYVLTSAHVITTAGRGGGKVEPAVRVYVVFADGDRIQGRLVGWDLFDDVAVVKVDPADHRLRPIPLGDSRLLHVGAPVAAIGSPFGHGGSLAVGVVSGVGRSIPSLTSSYYLGDAIQTDAPITRGNSGGPLLDARGNAVGINAQIRTETGVGEGVGFAVPINAAKRSLRQLIASGEVRYPYVGVATADLTPSLAEHLGLRVGRGALIQTITDDSPAARAGLRAGTKEEAFNGVEVEVGGDVIVAIQGRPVRGSGDVARLLLERHAPGDRVLFTVVRNDARRTIALRLATRPAEPGAAR